MNLSMFLLQTCSSYLTSPEYYVYVNLSSGMHIPAN